MLLLLLLLLLLSLPFVAMLHITKDILCVCVALRDDYFAAAAAAS